MSAAGSGEAMGAVPKRDEEERRGGNRSPAVLLGRGAARAGGRGYFGGAMTMTPWGDAGSLRERQLPPGRGRQRSEVLENQRERLLAAMVALCAEKGYAATSVADLGELSGVSTRSFYELFADKEACFLATMDAILQNLAETVLGELAGEGPIEERSERAAAALLENLRTQPAANRLWLVESFGAGEAARERMNMALDLLAGRLAELFESLGKGRMPALLTEAILGGVAGVVYTRIGRGAGAEVEGIAGPMREWALGFPEPPGPLVPRSRRRRPDVGGSPPFVAHVPGERIVRGFAEAVAEKGYPATTISDIAAQAQVSQTTVYAHFEGKPDILFAALDSSGAQMLAATLPALRRSPGWPGAMRVAAETLCAFYAAEPAFAHLREVEVFAVGPKAVRVRDRSGYQLVEVLSALAPGPPRSLDPLQVEATLAATHSLLYRWIRTRGARTLPGAAPLATYIALAPILGAQQAYEVACG